MFNVLNIDSRLSLVVCVLASCTVFKKKQQSNDARKKPQQHSNGMIKTHRFISIYGWHWKSFFITRAHNTWLPAYESPITINYVCLIENNIAIWEFSEKFIGFAYGWMCRCGFCFLNVVFCIFCLFCCCW